MHLKFKYNNGKSVSFTEFIVLYVPNGKRVGFRFLMIPDSDAGQRCNSRDCIIIWP